MSDSSRYSALLERLSLPQPQLQRHAVAALFRAVRSSADPAARDAVALCLCSPSPAVADQAARELCRLARRGLFDPSVALVELQSALEGCDLRLVGLFVKAIGFLCRSNFAADPGWGRRFDPVELHPFIKVLSSRDEVQAELIQQVLLFIVHNRTSGMEAVTRFLKPFFMYTVIHKPVSATSSTVGRDLISSVASLCCSLSSEAVSIIKLLIECLQFLPHTNEMEFNHLFSGAEYVVNSIVVVLTHIVDADKKLASTIQLCGLEVVDLLVSLCAYSHTPHGAVEFIVGLSKHFFIALRQLGLDYLPEFAIVTVPISVILARGELEHDHLSILKLLIFFSEWRTEKEHKIKGAGGYLCVELQFIFPVISLLSSPSKCVKAAATFSLSALEGLLSDLLNILMDRVSSQDGFPFMDSPNFIPFRLLNYLLFQDQSHNSRFTYLDLTCSSVSEVVSNSEPNYWMFQLRSYFQKLKRLSLSQSSAVMVAGIPSLISSIVTVLVMHPKFGLSAIDSLAAIGLVYPTLGMSLLQTLRFYIKMMCNHGSVSSELLLKLCEVLPSLASNSAMVPLVMQTIAPMLKNGNPVLYSIAIRLLCKTWILTGRGFGTLQEILDVKALSDFSSERQICISIALSIRDVCRHNPDRGVDLILSLSSCIESQDSTVQALGFEGLGYLCEGDVVDFYTAWDIIVKHSKDYLTNPIVARRICSLLRWGALDAAAYPEKSKTVMQILWNVACRDSSSSSLWVKARISALQSLSSYQVDHILDTFPDLRETNLRCFLTENNMEVLMAMKNFEIKIIDFEHINRRRVRKPTRRVAHKVEKLLDVFPQVVNSQGSASEVPGAALLSFVFTPKDMHSTSKDMAKLHYAYEKTLLEVSASLHVSRSILFALTALQSWKPFILQWIKGAIALGDAKKSSDVSDKCLRTANEIFKILCKAAADAIPRVAVNIALAVGALCMVLPSTAHAVIYAASEFLLKWLHSHEHEHRQWSAAISLGLVCNCLHSTDKAQKMRLTTELIEAVSNSESHLVKGACGVGLGYASQDLLSRIETNNLSPERSSSILAEITLLRDIIRTLSLTLSHLCPAASASLRMLNENFLIGDDNYSTEDFLKLPDTNCDSQQEDPWGIAGLVLGLGNSIGAIYRSGAYDTVVKLKDILISWIPQIDSSVQNSIFSRETTEVPLAMGSCLALPAVIAFCQRAELMNSDYGLVYRYGSLISALQCSKKSGILHQNLAMGSCIGAGLFISYIMTDAMDSVRLDMAKYLMEILRSTYSQPYPSLVSLGGMLGVVNMFGAGVGDLRHCNPQAKVFQHDIEQDSSLTMGLLLSSSVCEPLATSMIQELFLVAKESKDQQMKQYSAWALSFLREKWCSMELQNSNSDSVPSQSFDESTLVWKLCIWLRDLDLDKANLVVNASTVSTVFRCLSRAPKLPTFDWGAIIRRYMRYGAKTSDLTKQTSELLRDECICFSLAHASEFSSLLHFLDELMELSRFRTLELSLQSTLLCHLPDLFKIFSASRVDKLSDELVAYFSSSVYSYLSYDSDQRTTLRISFWKGLQQCLSVPLEELSPTSKIGKCIWCLFYNLPELTYSAKSETRVANGMEWSEAIRCLSKAPQQWLMDLLQVPDINILHESINIEEVAKKISTRARLVKLGCIPIPELDKIKAYILNTRSGGSWWAVLIDVAVAVSTTEGNSKLQWLLDALEISCISEYPSTALQFVGLLAGCCCQYMSLLIADPDMVLCDLPVTLPSLLFDGRWVSIAESTANKLCTSTERFCTWAAFSAGNAGGLSMQDGISSEEAPKSALYARALRQTCISLKEYLPLHRQTRLANLDVSQL